MNAYAYSFGGSENRAWAMLGALTSTLLLWVPLVLLIGAAIFRRFLGLQIPRGVHPERAQEGEIRSGAQTPGDDVAGVGAAQPRRESCRCAEEPTHCGHGRRAADRRGQGGVPQAQVDCPAAQRLDQERAGVPSVQPARAASGAWPRRRSCWPTIRGVAEFCCSQSRTRSGTAPPFPALAEARAAVRWRYCHRQRPPSFSLRPKRTIHGQLWFDEQLTAARRARVAVARITRSWPWPSIPPGISPFSGAASAA